MEPRERILNIPLPHSRPLLRSTERPCSRTGRYGQDESESDKVIGRINYLSWMIRVFEDYNETENLRIIKKFVAANSRRIKATIEDIQQHKDVLQKYNALLSDRQDRQAFRNYYLEQIQQLSSQNQHLDQQYAQQIQRKAAKQDNNIDRSSQEQLANLRATIQQLNAQIDQTNKLNARLTQNLSKYPFFAEYELTCKEIEGVKILNDKLRKAIQKRSEVSKSKALRQ